jgi:tetratricopeptide (TPR) repeat protein
LSSAVEEAKVEEESEDLDLESDTEEVEVEETAEETSLESTDEVTSLEDSAESEVETVPENEADLIDEITVPRDGEADEAVKLESFLPDAETEVFDFRIDPEQSLEILSLEETLETESSDQEVVEEISIEAEQPPATPPEALSDEEETETTFPTETPSEALEIEAEASTGSELAELGESEDLVEPVQEIDEKPIQERLEEADFYLKLDLRGDARRIVAELLEKFPEEEDVLSRARKIGLVPEVQTEVQDSLEPQPGPLADDYDVEVEAALDDLFDVSTEPKAGESDLGVEEAAETSEEDLSVQFDLGVAYREMGMFEDAISKFEEAFSAYEIHPDEEQSIRCASLLAATYLQLGNYRDTIKWADEGLRFSEIKSFEKKTLEYDRAQAFELLGEFDESLKGYRKVFEEDPDFRDVQTRISRIELLSD